MISNRLIVAASLFAVSLMGVKADWTSPNVSIQDYYAVYTSDGVYLHSEDSKIETQSSESLSDINNTKNKGFRYRFPEGIPGPVVCESHMDHFVGYDDNKGIFRTDIGDSSGKKATVEYYTEENADKKYIQIGVGGYYISTNGDRISHPAPWQFDVIDMV